MDLVALASISFIVLIHCCLAHKLPESGSAIGNLLTKFELKLQEAAFEALERHDRPFSDRSRRSTEIESWSGFVPGLYHHREQLVLDSVDIVSSTLVCREGQSSVELDAVYYFGHHYVFTICGANLNVYSCADDLSSLTLLNTQNLDNEALSVTHVKLYDNIKGDVSLFVLVLASDSLDVYSYSQGKLELFHRQGLLNEYTSIDVSYHAGSVYSTLIKGDRDGRVQPCIFEVVLSDGHLSFNLISFKSALEAGTARMCAVGKLNYLFQPNVDDSSLSVHIFHHQSSGRRLERHQILDAPGIKDLECFKVGASYYVAMATSSGLHILEYVNGLFETLQYNGDQRVDAISVLSPDTYRDEAMLLLQGNDSDGTPFMDLLLMDPATLTFMPISAEDCQEEVVDLENLPQQFNDSGVSCLAGVDGLNLKLSATLVQEGQLVVVFTHEIGAENRILLVKFGVHLQTVMNPISEYANEVNRRMEESEKSLEDFSVRSEQYKDFVEGVVLYDSDVLLKGSWQVEQLIVPAVSLNNLDDQNVTFNEDVWTDGLEIIVQDLENKLVELDELVLSIGEGLRDTVRNGTMDAVQLEQLSINGSLLIGKLHVLDLSLEQLNGYDYDATVNDIVRKDSDRVVESLKVLTGNLITNSLNAATINGIAVGDFVTGTEGVHITGDLHVDNSVFVSGDVHVNGTVNGIDLGRQLVTMSDSIESLVFHDGVFVQDLVVEGDLNDVSVEEMLASIIYEDSINVTFARASFEHVTMDGDLEIASNKIGDVDIVALNSSIVRLDGDVTVTGFFNFSMNVELEQSLGVDFMNGRNTSDLMLRRDLSDELVIGGKVFRGPVSARSISVEGLVNGHRLDNVFTLDSDQEITGPVELLGGFQSAGNLDLHTLNGVDYTLMMDKGVHPTLLGHGPQLKNVSITNSFQVDGTLSVESMVINRRNFVHLLNDVIYSDDEDVVLTGRKTLSTLSVQDLEVIGTVNSFKLLDDLLITSTDQEITGSYNLLKSVDMFSLDIKNYLNEYNITKLLDDVVLLNETQSIRSRLNFYENIVVEDIWINGTVNGIRTEDMAMDDVDQTFSALQILERPIFTDLKVGGNVVMIADDSYSKLINSIDIQDVERRRVTKSTYQEIAGSWKLNNATFQSLEVNGTLNSLTMADWNDSFVRLHSSHTQTLNGSLNIDELTIDGNVRTTEGINGYRLNDISQSAADIRTDVTIPTHVSFEHLESESLTVEGQVNGYWLDSLNQDAIRRNDTSTPITGTKVFDSIHVVEDVDVEMVNGGRLIDDYLHKNIDQVIKADLKIVAPVRTYDLSMDRYATLNGLKSESLFSSLVLPYNIHQGDVKFPHSVSVGLLDTLSVQHEDWNELLESLARVNESNHFTAPISFVHQLEIRGELSVERLNGVDVVAFANDVVLRDEDAVITGRKVVDNLRVHNLTTDRLNCASTLPDVIFAAEKVIRLDQDQTVEATIVFDEDLIVDGHVHLAGQLNGHSFPDGYFLLDVDQELPFNYSVDSITMLGDVEFVPGARIEGLDLKAECDNTWMVGSATKLQSKKTFQGAIRVKDIAVDHLVNDFDFDQEVVTLDGGGTIYGVPRLTKLIVAGNVSRVGLTNDIDLSDLAADALYLDEPIHSNGRWKMNTASIRGDNFLQAVDGKVNGFPIQRLINSATSVDSQETGESYQTTLQWYNAFRQSYFKIDYFDLNQTIVLPHEVTSLAELRLHSTSYLLIGTRQCTSMVYTRTTTQDRYSYAATINATGSVSKWLPLMESGSGSYCVASLSTTTSHCNESGAKLWLFQIADDNRVDMKLMDTYGSDIVDITEETVRQSYHLYAVGNELKEMEMKVFNETFATRIVEQSNIYERNKSILSHAMPFSSDMKLHSFLLGSKVMIAQTFPFDDSLKSGCPGVKIFSTWAGAMKLEHVVPACDVQHVTTFTYGNLPDNYLVLAQRADVAVYHYEGASGFVLRFRLPYPSAKSLKWIQYQNEGFLALAKQDRVAVFKAVTIGDYVRD